MPTLDDEMHMRMLHDFRTEMIPLYMAERRGYAPRAELERAVKSRELPHVPAENGKRMLKISDLEKLYGRPRGEIYGMHWGDPEAVQPLAFVKKTYMTPYIRPESTGLEIGPGGGRWTQYLTKMKRLYVVDYHQVMLDEIKWLTGKPHITAIRNNGNDFPGVPDKAIDFLMSFDVFVHLDHDIIAAYLANMRRILKPDAVVLLHYSDKTKIMAQINEGFAEMVPERMREMVRNAGYEIFQEDTTTMWHSSIMLFRPRA
jgi:SAM-dependent methyltransferase